MNLFWLLEAIMPAGTLIKDRTEGQSSKHSVELLALNRDPCEDGQFVYSANGVTVSDFITPDYYNPTASDGVQYSFGGNIRAPHTVLDGGYVSFGRLFVWNTSCSLLW